MFHFIYIFHIDGTEAPVYINDDGNGDGSFGGGDRNDEHGKKVALEIVRVQIPVKCHEINIDRIQYQFYRHQDGNQVLSRKESVNTEEEHDGTDDQEIFERYTCIEHINLIFFF
jgi:hypothetical protein